MPGQHAEHRKDPLSVIQGIPRVIFGGVSGAVPGVILRGRPFYFQLVYGDEDARQPIITNGLCPFAAVGQPLRTRGGYAPSRPPHPPREKPSVHFSPPPARRPLPGDPPRPPPGAPPGDASG